jgi:hypothetical protein
MSIKIMTGICFLATLAFLGLAVSGRLTDVKALIGASASDNAARTKAVSDSFIGRAEINQTETELDGMFDVIRVNSLINSIDPDKITQAVKDENSSYDINTKKTPLKVSAQGIVICRQPNYYWVCGTLGAKLATVFVQDPNQQKAITKALNLAN